MTYDLKPPTYYRNKTSPMSNRLWRACWSQYRAYLNGSIDDPTCDEDVIGWLESIASEKVNNSRSTFYIYG